MADINQFGLDIGIYGPLARADTIIDLACFAEKSGFNSIWLADHIVFPSEFESLYPYSSNGDFPVSISEPLMEPIATMGVLVGATKTIRLGTAVLIMPYRNPILLARMLITIDQFSKGRIILGAGVGWLREEFEVMNTFDFEKRGQVTDEYIEIFKLLSKGGEVSYNGSTYQFPQIYSVPGSVQKPHPPVLIGGIADPALRRVVNFGDGWLAVALDAERMKERLKKLKNLCKESNRNFNDLDLVYKIFINPGDPKPGPFGGREVGTGSEIQIIDDLKSIFDAGFNSVVVRYRGESTKVQTEQMERFASDIIPKI
ncbi:MAG: hypothetical protein CMM58_12050 [Rhodospirillaceae bacterium]|nr:hypothetical protein [Rhodospirillaceae bacterium]